MNEIIEVKGRAIPKPEDNQNTDDICPARFLKEITFANMGKYAYFDERFPGGQENPDHPFNNARYKGANILVAGANYGCGSSREHAPQALKRFGIDAIVAVSFAEIFAGNCEAIGIVPVTVDNERGDLSYLLKCVREHPEDPVKICVAAQEIYFADEMSATIPCNMPKARRQAFLDGTWDILSVLQQDPKEVERTMKRLDYLNW